LVFFSPPLFQLALNRIRDWIFKYTSG